MSSSNSKSHGRLLAAMLLLAAAALPSSAFALELGEAKQRGLLGETPSGYLEAVKPPTAEVQALMSEINAKRRAEYQRIAKENNTPLSAVEKLAAEKAIEKTPAGQYVKTPGGSWVRK